MKITVVLGAVASAVLLFFGFIFLLSAGSVTSATIKNSRF